MDVLDELIRTGIVKNNTEFCKRTHLTKQTLSAIRRGKRKITIDSIIKIYEQYRGNPFYILFGTGDKRISAEFTGSDQEIMSTPDMVARLEELLSESIKIQRELLTRFKG